MPQKQLSYLTQVRKLRDLANKIIDHYPITVSKIKFIHYGTNATFKVIDKQHKSYLLRILPDNFHLKKALLEEIKWLNYIIKTTDILVPHLVKSCIGESWIEGIFGEHQIRYCILFEWINGKRLWKGIEKNYAFHLGKLMGQLQKNGKNLTLEHRLYWDVESLVGIQHPKHWNVEKLSDITVKQQDIIARAREFVYKKLKDYETNFPDKSGLIHGDLNPNNIIVQNKRYAVIDFDDCGIGLYGYDIANALHAFQNLIKGSPEKNYRALEESLFNGYTETMPLSQVDIDTMPYFLLAQRLSGVGALELRKNNTRMRSYFLTAVNNVIETFQKCVNK